MRYLACFPLAATLLLSWAVPAVHALPNEILIAQTSAKDYLEQGNARYNRRDYQGAIEDYTKAISLKPDFAEAYNNRGHARGTLKDHKGAIEDFNKAISLKPDYASAYSNRGAARIELKDYQGAIEDTSRAISLTPDYATAYSNRGEARNSLKDYKGGIEDATKAISIEPDDAEAYRNRGTARESLKDYQGAKSDKQKAADLFLKLKSKDTVGSQKAIDKQTIPPRPNNPSTTLSAQRPSNSIAEEKQLIPAIDDTQGLDFGPYMEKLQSRVKSVWSPPQQEKSRKSVLRFSISRNGEVSNLRVDKSSENSDSDAAAMAAVRKAAPFESLPTEYKGKGIDIQFTFDINVSGSNKVSEVGSESTPNKLTSTSCEDEDKLSSLVSSETIGIQFVNKKTYPVKVYWIDFKGKRQHYFDLEPNQVREQQTYVTHPWLIADSRANQPCVGVFLPNSKQGIATIE